MASQGFSLVSCQQSLLRVSSLHRGEKMALPQVTPIQCQWRPVINDLQGCAHSHSSLRTIRMEELEHLQRAASLKGFIRAKLWHKFVLNEVRRSESLARCWKTDNNYLLKPQLFVVQKNNFSYKPGQPHRNPGLEPEVSFFQLTSEILNLIQHVNGKSSFWPKAMMASLSSPHVHKVSVLGRWGQTSLSSRKTHVLPLCQDRAALTH